MFLKFIDFAKRVAFSTKTFLVNFGRNLVYRMKPRRNFTWIVTAILWLIIICYLGFGIFVATQVYHKHSESKLTFTSIKFYPMPAAIVNSSVVWAKDYYQQLSYIRQFSSKTKQAVPEAGALRTQIIEQLIENKILEVQATKNHISVTNKDINDAYQKIVDQSGGATEVKKVLTDLYGMNEKEFKQLIRQQVLKEKIQNELITQVKVSHILIKDEAQANAIADRAKKNEDFAALAKQYSEDTKSNAAGGELGWLARGQFVVNDNPIPEFDTAAFAGKKDTIIGPVKTSVGFEIIKIEDKKGKVDQDFNTWLAEQEKQAKIWRILK
jgi:parvulin-like peptidyl-prolyl isomerase